MKGTMSRGNKGNGMWEGLGIGQGCLQSFPASSRVSACSAPLQRLKRTCQEEKRSRRFGDGGPQEEQGEGQE